MNKKQILVLALASIAASVFAAPPTVPTPVLPFGSATPTPNFNNAGAVASVIGNGSPSATNVAQSISGLNTQLNHIGWAFGYGVSGTGASGSSYKVQADDFLAASKTFINGLQISSPIVARGNRSDNAYEYPVNTNTYAGPVYRWASGNLVDNGDRYQSGLYFQGGVNFMGFRVSAWDNYRLIGNGGQVNFTEATQDAVNNLRVDQVAYTANLAAYKQSAYNYTSNSIFFGSNGVNALSNLIGYGDVLLTWNPTNGFATAANVPAITLQSAVTDWNTASANVGIDSTYHNLTGLNQLATAGGNLSTVSGQVTNFGQNLQTASQQFMPWGNAMLTAIDAASYANITANQTSLVSALGNVATFVSVPN